MAVSINRATSRQRSRRHSGQAFADINVTPFVDVMLVLLVIFMVTAPMLTVGVPVDLPKTKAAKMNDQTDPLVVSVDANGKSYLQETELQGDALIERLIAVSGSNPDARIYVRGDQKIHYGRVMEIMGEISAAGFSKVSLIAEMPPRSSKPSVLSRPVVSGPVPMATMPQHPQMIPQQSGPKPFVKANVAGPHQSLTQTLPGGANSLNRPKVRGQ